MLWPSEHHVVAPADLWALQHHYPLQFTYRWIVYVVASGFCPRQNIIQGVCIQIRFYC